MTCVSPPTALLLQTTKLQPRLLNKWSSANRLQLAASSRPQHLLAFLAAAPPSSSLSTAHPPKHPPKQYHITRRLASYCVLLAVAPLSDRFAFATTGNRNRRMATAAAATPNRDVDLEAFGKAASGSGSPSKERGDCPFSQRIYIELEEKGLPYTATFIEEGPNKPDWFIAKNPKGLMPLLRDGEQWIQDSDKIAEHLEEKYPEHSLKTPPEFKRIGIDLFPAFTSWLKSKTVDGPPKESFVKELKALDDHLQSHGPFIAGSEPSDSDFALAPKLRHARVAIEHFIGWKIPNDYSAVLKYIELLESRPSFRKSDSPDSMIIQGWQKKFSLPDRIAKEPQPAA